MLSLNEPKKEGPEPLYPTERGVERYHVAFGLTTQIEHHLFPGIGNLPEEREIALAPA